MPDLSDLKLRPKQLLFAAAYASNGHNGTQAYKDAGYTASTTITANVSASKLLRLPKVTTAIARLQAGTAERIDVDQDKLVAEYWSLYTDARDKRDISGARSCLHDLGELIGLFSKNVNVKHSGDVAHRMQLDQLAPETLDRLLEWAHGDAELAVEDAGFLELDAPSG